jgi:periplasmic protein CpxP/Spy
MLIPERKQKNAALTALVAAVMVITAVGFYQLTVNAQGPGHGGRGEHQPFGWLGRDLNLTDAQKAQLKQIADNHRQATKSLWDQRKALESTGYDPFQEGTFNEAAARAAAQARANLEVELQVAHARMQSEMFAILTPDQKTKLIQSRQQHRQREQQEKE